MAKKGKLVYFFGSGKAEGKADMKNLLGGKGANLAEMTNLGVPVPAGFTITTEVCTAYYKNNKKYPAGLEKQVGEAMSKAEKAMGAKFGDAKNPLLVSVRSGARVSMPGMMDTVLNLGLNDTTVKGLIEQSGNERFGYDSYRRFIQMFSNVVLDMEHHDFEHILDGMKKKKGVKNDTDLTADDLKNLVDEYKKIVKKATKKDFPTDPKKQLWLAVEAVFKSWNTPRAIRYRKLEGISDDWGTAVNVQSMVFGNMGDDCATGVAFTRNPSTGEHKFYGEYLINAQGEDVVAGIRTPHPITKAEGKKAGMSSLEEEMPKPYKDLEKVYKKLEKHYKDMQDIEFTIQKGKLYMLQTRTGKRTAASAVKIAVDMVKEKLIDEKTAIMRVAPKQIDQLLHPMIDPKAKRPVIAKGLPASPGAATGQVVFNAHEAEKWAETGKKVLLVRIETSPDDIGGMVVAQGILTARGGMTSHAAVVARGMGKCCVAGCGDIEINYATKKFTVKGKTFKEGDWITLDGSTGEVMEGQLPTVEPKLSGDFGKLMVWADKYRTINVRTNADTPHDAKVARDFGAEGIGLCRTEHMFFEGDRVQVVRQMILAEDEAGRRKALAKLLPMQKGDFFGIFKAMKGLPVTIRLLDPPLHEFLPQEEKDIAIVAKALNVSPAKIRSKIEQLHEFNPMLGHRGCRLGVTYPEIYEMQVEAIILAAVECKKKGIKVLPEIMIPLVGAVPEFTTLEEMTRAKAEEIFKAKKTRVDYMVGTMIEIPRAALLADKVAERAEFFSFGTNDLTQMTFGYSRDDAGVFLPEYVDKKILPEDPFQVLDQEGVGKLVEMGVKLGRKSRPKLKVGICGEHGGEPKSVGFCHSVGMNYVSCSPFRVPIARLAAAQAALLDGSWKKKGKK